MNFYLSAKTLDQKERTVLERFRTLSRSYKICVEHKVTL